MRKNDAFDAKIVNTRLTKIFIAIFAPDERLPSSATLAAKEVVGMEVRGGMTNELVFLKYEMASRQFIIRERSW